MAEKWVFLNGAFCLEKLATLPISDRGFLFGDGIFTTIRVNHGRCEFLSKHLDRLRKHAEWLAFSLQDVTFDWVEELIRHNAAQEGVWRLKIIITVQEHSGARTQGNFLATLNPYLGPFSQECRLTLFPKPCESPLGSIKSLSYLDHLYIKNYATQRNYDDALVTTASGFLLETGSSNFFWFDRERLCMPDPQLPYIKGILLQILQQHLPLPMHYVRMTIDQLPPNANLYICNALTHVRPVLSIDDKSFPQNKQWENLMQDTIKSVLAIC